MADKPPSGIVQRSVACHDGGWLCIVRIARPKQDVSVRAAEPLREGQHVSLRQSHGSWSLA